MKKLAIIILFILNSLNTTSQVKDTVYIYFDSINCNMKKGTFIDKRVKDPIKSISITYYIDEKETKFTDGYDKGYTFWHRNRDENSAKLFSYKQPLTLERDICNLKKYKLLDTYFFKKTDYHNVCKTFEKEDSWEQDVIIFIIDKDEIKDGKLILREVTFSRPVKE